MASLEEITETVLALAGDQKMDVIADEGSERPHCPKREVAVVAGQQLDAKTRIQRFCYLGSQEAVYIHLRRAVNVVEYWPKMSQLCQALDDFSFIQIMKDILQQTTLVRRDEALFIYAVYLSTDVDIKWKTTVRIAFPSIVINDDDLFLFAKYCLAIQKEKKHKGFSKTMRKAITAWYEQHQPADIQKMWMQHRGAHGFTHKALLKMCHVNDATIGEPGIVSPFFRTCTELIKMSDVEETKTEEAKADSAPSESKETVAAAVANDDTKATATKDTATIATTSKVAKSKQQTTQITTPVISMSRLRLTRNPVEALKIIQVFRLSYNQVPGYLLRYASIMETLIPTMTHLQLLKCWRHMARFNHFQNPRILKLCQTILNNKNKLAKLNVHPLVILLQMNRMGIRDDITKLPSKKVESLRMSYLKDVYMQSYGHNQATGLRMHITINLQTSYKKKFLNNTKKLSFIEAAVALAFGYFKKEKYVDVFHWEVDPTNLAEVAWTKEMSIKDAMECCKKVENPKNSQRLVVPIMNALKGKKVYDVFVAIVPSAGRSNPNQSSSLLCKFLDKYRESRNSRAKFVIVNLRKFKRSMKYSQERVENILEICGIDEHTTDLINNFALNRFG